MKVGLMTFFVGQNYGALLQAWALWQILSDLGCDVEFIDYHHPWSKTPYWWNWRSYVARTPNGVYKRFKTMIHHLKLRKQFGKMESIFPRTLLHYGDNPSKLYQNPPNADVYVVGSDQVWRTVLKWYEYIKPYFLPFGEDNISRIAYAASLGGDEFPKEKVEEISNFISRFRAISTRESNGAEYISNLLGRNVDVMPDPTLVMGGKGFMSLRDKAKPMSNGREVYYIMDGISSGVSNILKSLSGERSFNIALQNFRLGLGRDFIPEVPQFVDVIAKSQCVITNSFHACVFAILYHRRFWFIPFEGAFSARNERIVHLLSTFGLESRIAKPSNLDDLLKNHEETINWNYVDEKLSQLRQDGIKWLRDALFEKL